MSGPLEGIRILDLSWVLAGPFCTMNLSDLGAEVIKLERPNVGDLARGNGPFIDGESSYFLSINRGKKSIALNLTDDQDIALIKNIIKKADVLVENFRPGVMDKLGFGYEEIKKINPKIIYASVSGFGHTGPKKFEPGFNMIAQGYSGIMSVCGEVGTKFQRVGISIGDIVGGFYAYMAIMTALYAREKNNKGTYIDIAMLDGLFSAYP